MRYKVLSIIMPVFNEEATLANIINTVLSVEIPLHKGAAK